MLQRNQIEILIIIAARTFPKKDNLGPALQGLIFCPYLILYDDSPG